MGGRLAGKRVLISATGQGIGRASAIAMAAEGAHVFATDVNKEALATLEVEAAKTCTGKVETFHMDVLDDDAVKAGVERAQPDVLFNCAGFVHNGTVEECTDSDWDFAFSLNVRAMFKRAGIHQIGGQADRPIRCTNTLHEAEYS